MDRLLPGVRGASRTPLTREIAPVQFPLSLWSTPAQPSLTGGHRDALFRRAFPIDQVGLQLRLVVGQAVRVRQVSLGLPRGSCTGVIALGVPPSCRRALDQTTGGTQRGCGVSRVIDAIGPHPVRMRRRERAPEIPGDQVAAGPAVRWNCTGAIWLGNAAGGACVGSRPAMPSGEGYGREREPSGRLIPPSGQVGPALREHRQLRSGVKPGRPQLHRCNLCGGDPNRSGQAPNRTG